MCFQNHVDEDRDTYLFDVNLIEQVDWESRKAQFKNGISPAMPGEALTMRPLCIKDFEKGKILITLGDIRDQITILQGFFFQLELGKMWLL